MMMQPFVRRYLLKILPFGVTWGLFGLIYAILERGILGDFDYYPATNNPYHFESSIVLTTLGSILMGLVMGSVEVFYLSRFFTKYSFLKTIGLKAFIYILSIIGFLVILTMITNSIRLGLPLFHPEVLSSVKAFYSAFAFWSIVIYAFAIVMVSLFFSAVSDKIGLNALNNFFTGRYHKPKIEKRIFMFMDLKSSTTIAEELGHVKYFKLLNQYFTDISPAIIKHRGRIYQYVGDEVIISWNLPKGVRNNNCIKCFFESQRRIDQNKEYYISQFGLVPKFKAGVHYGKVTTGEIGKIKKEIVFTGDVLNSAARIQEMCNELDTNFLISNEIAKILNDLNEFHLEEKGLIKLKGKKELMKLFSVQLN